MAPSPRGGFYVPDVRAGTAPASPADRFWQTHVRVVNESHRKKLDNFLQASSPRGIATQTGSTLHSTSSFPPLTLDALARSPRQLNSGRSPVKMPRALHGLKATVPAPGAQAPAAEAATMSKEASALQHQIKNKVDITYSSLRHAFTSMDKDRSGYLTVDEIRSVLKTWNMDHDPEAMERVLQQLMKTADKDGDGRIEYNEFAQGLAHSQVQETQVFGCADDHTGIVGHVVMPGMAQVFLNENLSAGKRAEGSGIRIQGDRVHGDASRAIKYRE